MKLDNFYFVTCLNVNGPKDSPEWHPHNPRGGHLFVLNVSSPSLMDNRRAFPISATGWESISCPVCRSPVNHPEIDGNRDRTDWFRNDTILLRRDGSRFNYDR